MILNEVVKLATLQAAEKNVRTHNRKQVDELCRSLTMFGQIRPAIIDENNVVWCGNGLVMAARQLGWEEIEVKRVTGLTEKMKYKLMLADNQIFTLGAADTVVMDSILTELQDFDIPGYDADVLNQLYGNIEEAAEALQNYGVIDQESVQRIEATEASRNDQTDVQVFTQAEAEKASSVPSSPSGGIQDVEKLLPPTIKTTDGVVNVPTNKNERPFILCPKCGEKIYV